MKDFTLSIYSGLLKALLQAGYHFVTFEEWCTTRETMKTVILRHDVDRKPKRALRMARIESDVGVRSTYYFRSTKEAFIPEIMKEIEKMGHEVGYHYEVLVKSKGDDCDGLIYPSMGWF